MQFDIHIDREELLSKIDAEVKKIARKANLKGFRPGHVPPAVIRKMYGHEILEAAFDELATLGMSEFLNSKEAERVIGLPLPADNHTQPELSIHNLQDEYKLSYEVGLYPDMEIKGLSSEDEYESFVLRLPEEHLDKLIDNLAFYHGEDKEITEGAAPSDTLEIEIKELDGEQVKEGGWQTTSKIMLNERYPEAIRNFLGKRASDVVRINLQSETKEFWSHILITPEEDVAAGNEFEVRILKVFRREPVPLTEEFFQSLFGENIRTKEEAIEIANETLTRKDKPKALTITLLFILSRLQDLNPLELPERYVKALFAAEKGKKPDEATTEYEAFWKDLKRRFFIQHLQKLADAHPTNEDIQRAIVEQARMDVKHMGLGADMTLDLARHYLEDREFVEEERSNLIISRILQKLSHLVKMRTRFISKTEMVELLEKATAQRDEILLEKEV